MRLIIVWNILIVRIVSLKQLMLMTLHKVIFWVEACVWRRVIYCIQMEEFS